ncbi:exported protein [Yersinia pseudotuberculosis]|nr:exported protein [Yersinia pseudotuberculosis]
MSKNTKQTSGKVASIAAKTLNDPNSSAIQRSLAGSALSNEEHQIRQVGKWSIKHLLHSIIHVPVH